MAIELVGSNLNEIGNAGSFESDISTWGFDVSVYGNASLRSAAFAHAGLYSNQVITYDTFGIFDYRTLPMCLLLLIR